ncbi:MAG: hypothetical protein CM1200mP10_28420 [Candidatus Neomarinimicrobiota bacterium]|nr:MAG: hypothetical protein CM1200mP10_28420 [Candidatus Neomarinimicrobiota bacterium]
MLGACFPTQVVTRNLAQELVLLFPDDFEGFASLEGKVFNYWGDEQLLSPL